jgi:signal transduction histidine kinase
LLSTRQEGEEVVLVVRDTGQGMTPEVLGKLFQPFFSTKPLGEGTGMGLAVVHGIVSAHGGRIQVESQPGKGSTFTLRLPRVPPTA